ncbi:MAG: DUF502 domain-containing protein [Henriciella sp.]|uniref:DUF502 domain-containing protein n=1 Tax=Henriciella sp. TaxID=1968823 RepID=UPI0032EC178E
MAKRTKSENGIMNPKPRRPSLWAWLRGRFLAGMVIAAPVAVTFYVLQFLINFIDNRVKPLLPPIIQPETYTNYAIPGFGVLVMIVALTLLGAITTNLIGRSIISAADRILSRLPIVRNVYAAFKQLTEVIANNQQASYDRVVMIEYPKRGSWCLGFVSAGAKGEIRSRLGEGFIGVFVPTTPNPTSGFLMYVKEEECIEMEMSIEEGAKMILSAGLVVPDYGEDEAPEQRSLPLPDEGAEKLSKQA